MISFSTNPPPGVKIIDAAQIRSLQNFDAELPAEDRSLEAWGLACDQRCLMSAMWNVFLMLSASLPIIMISLIFIEYGFDFSACGTMAFSIIIVAYCFTLIFYRSYALGINISWRVWIIASRDKIIWLRKSLWGKDAKFFDRRMITGVHHVRFNGGAEEGRVLKLLVGPEETALLYNCGGHYELCTWAAQTLIESLNLEQAEFINIPAQLPWYMEKAK